MRDDDPERTSVASARAAETSPLVLRVRAGRPEPQANVLSSVLHGLFGEQQPPPRIGRYLLLERVGQGGMGVVYSAYDPELDRRVAVKLVAGAIARDGEGVARLRREAQALARVSHPNVVAVHDVGVTASAGADTTVFVVMELVEGVTLQRWLAARRRSWREIVRVFADAGRGIAAAHAHGLVHRDFKPSNSMIDARGVVRVLDFGLARMFHAASDGDADVARSSTPEGTGSVLADPVTRRGAIPGTPRYMAPEQLAGARVDGSADQYALSLALYEAFYGSSPWACDDLQELLACKRAGRIPPPPPGSDVPARVHDVVVRGLAGDPATRFPSVAAWVEALERDPWRPRRRAVALAMLAAAGIAIVVARPVVHAWQLASCRERHAKPRWNEAARGEMRAAFGASGLAFAEPVHRWLARELDLRAQTLASARGRVCEAAADGIADRDVAARHACLDHVRARLDGTVSAVREAGPGAVMRASELAALPSTESCEHAMSGNTSSWTTDDLELVHDLARTEASLHVGRAEHAQALALGIVERARASGAMDLVAESEILRGRAAKAMGHAEIAEAAIAEALAIADATGDEVLATQAMVHLADAIAVLPSRDLSRAPEARRLLELARGRLDRLPLPETFAAVVHGELGELDEAAGDVTSALAHYREGLAIRERALGPEHPLTAAALDSIGVALQRAGDPEAALHHLERALEIRTDLFGPTHPAVSRTLNNLALVHSQQGRLRQAIALNERAIEIDEEVFAGPHPQLAVKLANVGFLYLGVDEPGEARARFAAGQEVLDGLAEVGARDAARTLRGYGIACRRLGLADEARAAHARALDAVAELPADDPERVASLSELARSSGGAS